MKADFAYIEQAYTQRLERELVQPRVPDTVDEPDNIAGFLVKDPERGAARRAALARVRIDHVKNFQEDREELFAALQAKAIAPLAILPAAGWRYLCAIGGLYQLHPESDGAIRVSTTRCLDRIERQATWLKWGAFFALAVAVGTALVGLAPSPSALPNLFGVLWFCACVLGPMSIIVVFANFLAHPDLGRTGFARLLLRWYDRAPARRVMADFFPDPQPDGSGEREYFVRRTSTFATLVFPEPPADVAALLCKARGFDLRIAAVAEAIGFTQPPSEILRPEMTARRAARVAAAADPVIYVQSGSAVAILAQYGDFPLERDSVDLAVESEYLL